MRVGRVAILCAMMLGVGGCAVFQAPEREAPEPPSEPKPSEAEAPEAPKAPDAPPPPPAVERVRAPETELDRLLNYFQQLKRLAGVDLGREHDNARAAFGRTRGDFDRVRLAMVLSIPNTPVSDDARALELLEPMMKNENSQLRGLAVLMGTYMQEQRRLGANVQGLQQKLNALKSLERSLIEREQGGQKRR